MESQKSQKIQKVILLPSKVVPQQLKQFIQDLKDYSVRFINGYRNILQIENENEISWILGENENYCGQAFCYLLKSQVNKEDLMKKQFETNHVIKEVNDRMLILQSRNQTKFSAVKLSKQKISSLIEEVSESKQARKLGLNILKNAFQSYEQFQKIVGENILQIEKQVDLSKQQKIPTVTETIAIQLQAKKLHGDMIVKLPKCNQETGEWDQKELIQIKLLDK